jgi:hypothetical protein
MMFAVLRSRWMMPTSWIAESPLAMDRDVEGLLRGVARLALADHLLQVDAFDQLHRDVADALILAVLVDAADVAMRDLTGQPDLRAEAAGHVR